MTRLGGILHTEFNEYDSIIKPVTVWLAGLGVQFRMGTTITDIATEAIGAETLATGLTIRDARGARDHALSRDDLVFFTNGSLTQNATMSAVVGCRVGDWFKAQQRLDNLPHVSARPRRCGPSCWR